MTAIKVSMVFKTKYIGHGWVLEIFIDTLHGKMAPKALVAGSPNVQNYLPNGRHIPIFMLGCLPFSQKCLFQCFWRGRHPSSHGHKRDSFLPLFRLFFSTINSVVIDPKILASYKQNSQNLPGFSFPSLLSLVCVSSGALWWKCN